MVFPERLSLRRAILLGIGVLVACGAAVLAFRQILRGNAARDRYERLLQERPAMPAVDAEAEASVRAFCGDCHAVPRPESFHRDAWHDEVRRGYEFYAKSERTDLKPPPIHVTTAYFRSRAPERLVYPQPVESTSPLPVAFKRERLTLEPGAKFSSAISHLCWTRLAADAPPVLLASDMRTGDVVSLDLRRGERKPRPLARLENPCRIEPCDLDGDGAIDLLVSDLGSFSASDHDRGQVVWLRPDKGKETFEKIVLARGLGRVADVRVADFDGDGRPDLLVAVFGNHTTGKILLLRNVASRGQTPRFEPKPIDPRPGTIHVPVHDFDRDGRPDFLALVSQEYECVDLFLNQGNGDFRRRTLWSGPDLSFGSSGIELVDLNGDGRLDIFYTNGDAFDNKYLSPWHGVQWLENLGDLRFAYHRLTDMPGACRAAIGDFEGNGSPDLVVTAWVPDQFSPDTLKPADLPSIVLLKQTSPGQFVRHTLETGFPYHAAIASGDFDGDGALDFVAGVHTGNAVPATHWAEIWWNQGKPPAKGRLP